MLLLAFSALTYGVRKEFVTPDFNMQKGPNLPWEVFQEKKPSAYRYNMQKAKLLAT